MYGKIIDPHFGMVEWLKTISFERHMPQVCCQGQPSRADKDPQRAHRQLQGAIANSGRLGSWELGRGQISLKHETLLRKDGVLEWCECLRIAVQPIHRWPHSNIDWVNPKSSCFPSPLVCLNLISALKMEVWAGMGQVVRYKMSWSIPYAQDSLVCPWYISDFDPGPGRRSGGGPCAVRGRWHCPYLWTQRCEGR